MSKDKPEEKEQQLAVLTTSTIVPQTFKELNEFAQIIAKTDMIPNAYKGKPGDCLVAMMMGHELGLPYLMALQNIATINGKPSIYGDLGLALVRGGGRLESFDEYDQGEALAKEMGRCVVKRLGDKKERVFTFSIADAKRAGLWGKEGPWSKYPGRMLQMRARAFALRDVFPDVLKGLGLAEEAQDFIDTTAERVLPPAATTIAGSPANPANVSTASATAETVKTPAAPAPQAATASKEEPKAPAPVPSPGEPPLGYLIDKVTKSAHAGLFFIFINGVRYNCSDEDVAKGAYDLCETNKKTDKPKRIDFVSEIQDGTPILKSYSVIADKLWP